MSEETEGQGSAQSWREAHSRYTEVELSRPILVHGEEVSKLRIREPWTDDLELLPGKALDRPLSVLTFVLARCASVPPSSVRMISAADLGRCAEALAGLGFIPSDAYAYLGSSTPSPETGRTGSG